ncbi:unnamed protein product, partial [marine sediment metagenome]
MVNREENKKINDYLMAHPPVYNEEGYYNRMSNILGVSNESVRKRCRTLGLTHIRINKQVKGKLKIDEKKISIDDIRNVTKKVFEKLKERKRLHPKYKITGNLKPEKWLQIFSDLQYGLIVNKVEVGGLGFYSPQIAKERLEYLI